MSKAKVTQTKIKAKELYEELGISFAEFKELAAAGGIEVKAWNTALAVEEADKIRSLVKGQGLVNEIGLSGEALADIAGALKINAADPTALPAADIERIKSCVLAYELAREMGITFIELQKLGSKIGIEIGRVGYKGLSGPEKQLLKAMYRTQYGRANPALVKEAPEVEERKFAAPTGNKVEAPPTAERATRPVKGRGRGDAAPRGDGGTPTAGIAARTGRKRFEVKDTSYASQRTPRHAQSQTVGSAPRLEMPTGPVTVELPINLRQLSEALGVKVNDIMAELMREKMFVRINDSLSPEILENIGIALNREITVKQPKSAEELIVGELEKYEDTEGDLTARAPVVTVMGHVDHGKTSLLDAINRMDRAGGEAGGITQHIGAFRVQVDREDGKHMEVTFIDTPGHKLFTEMRARGAQVTDVAVIVVAADDGVMPQTIEAIAHAQAAGVEIVVAINKIDKPDANVARTRQMLASHNLMSPDWGGNTEIIEVSAATGKGVPKLIETLSDLTQLLELKANAEKPAVGAVLDAQLSEGRGIVATVLVQEGTLRKGQAIVAGHGYGRVRAMYDSRGSELDEAGPSWPVQVTGLSELPEAGAKFHGLDDLRKAHEIAEKVRRQEKELERARSGKPLTLESWSQERGNQERAELRLVVKTDVQGTGEAIRHELESFSHEEVSIRILHAAVGNVSTNDVRLAEASGAIIIGFNIAVEPTAQELADNHHVDIRRYEVVYKLLEDIHDALEGLLKPEEVEVELGVVEVRKIFKASKIGIIAGCMVTEGVVTRNAMVRLYRDGEMLFDGQIESLKRFKDEVKEVREGFDCGIVLNRFKDIQEGDILRPYVIETRERTLNS